MQTSCTSAGSSPVEILAKKVSRAIAGLRMVRKYLPFKTLVNLYHSLIQLLFDYCSIVWFNVNACQTERLQKLQNRAARIITQSSYEIRSQDILNDLKWDNLSVTRSKHLMIMMHNIMHGKAPKYLTNKFHGVMNSTHYNLRNKDINLKVSKPNSKYMRKCFIYQGVRSWNLLPSELKKTESIVSFKKCINTSPPTTNL